MMVRRWRELINRLVWVVLAAVLGACSMGGTAPTGEATAPGSGELPAPTSTAPAPLVEVKRVAWLVMLYAAGDDPALDRWVYQQVNEAELVGSSPDVHVVAQIDRVDGPATRYYLSANDDLSGLASEQVAALGEVNMADDATLADFVGWAVRTYPAERTLLVMIGAGLGWPGGLSDVTGRTGDEPISLAATLGDHLWLNELEVGLERGLAAGGISRLDAIAFDASYMGQLEVAAALAPYADVLVATGGVMPPTGLAYSALLTRLVNDPTLAGRDVAALMVEDFVSQDVIVTDDVVRRQFLAARQGVPLADPSLDGGAAALAESLLVDMALAAVDLRFTEATVIHLNQVLALFERLPSAQVRETLALAYRYGNPYDREAPSPYVDFGSYPRLLREVTFENIPVEEVVDPMVATLGNFSVAAKAGPGLDLAYGLGFYYPSGGVDAGLQADYTRLVRRFDAASDWPDYVLATLAETPGRTGLSRVGLYERPLAVLPVQLDPQPVSLEETLVISVGAVGPLYSAQSVVGTLNADQTVFTPVSIRTIYAEGQQQYGQLRWWQGQERQLFGEWTPEVWQMTDGVVTAPVQLWPAQYPARDRYVIYGQYVFLSGQAPKPAALLVDVEQPGAPVVAVWVFAGTSERPGDARMVLPQPGERFVPVTLSLNTTTGAVRETAGVALTFGQRTLQLRRQPAPGGLYVAGLWAVSSTGKREVGYDSVVVFNGATTLVPDTMPISNQALGVALLRPNGWQASALPDNSLLLTLPGTSVQVVVQRVDVIGSALNAEQANEQALSAVYLRSDDLTTLDQVAITSAVRAYGVPTLNGERFGISVSRAGQFTVGEVLLSTPNSEATFALVASGTVTEFSAARDDLEIIFSSFDPLTPATAQAFFYYPPSGYETLLFADAMTDVSSGLPVGEDADGFQVYDDVFDRYVVQLQPNSGPRVAAYSNQALPNQFSLAVDATMEDSLDAAVGLVFQWVGNNTFYALRVSGDGYFTLERADGRRLTPLIDWTPLPESIEPGLSGRLRLQVEGREGTYSLFVNGEPLGVFTDLTLQRGSFGVIADNFDLRMSNQFTFTALEMGTLPEIVVLTETTPVEEEATAP